MTDSFYSGGFLYDSVSKKVLLHKRDHNTKYNPNMWAFFGGMSIASEKPIDTFIRELSEETGIDVAENKIHPLTDYLNTDLNIYRYIFYVEADKDTEIILNEGFGFAWFSFDEAYKQDLTKLTKRDLETFKQRIED